MLTESQHKAYQAIQQYFLRFGRSPTVAELTKSLGLHSRGVVYRALKALAAERLIELLPGQRRNIRLSEEGLRQENLGLGCLPLLGRIAAGKPIEAISEQAYLNVSEVLLGPKRYLLEVKGESMIGDNICDGDLIICEHRQMARNGEIVVALVRQSEVTLKRIHFNRGGTVTLFPSNPAMQSMTYPAHEVVIQGVYLGLIRVRGR
jgi:repressor LexA